jgi:hypothetical protein
MLSFFVMHSVEEYTLKISLSLRSLNQGGELIGPFGPSLRGSRRRSISLTLECQFLQVL